MEYVLSNEQIQAGDKYTIEQLGLKGEILMESAGKACAEKIISIIKNKKKSPIVILSGKGNNGGDGYVIARYLHSFGLNVEVWTLADEKSLQGDAAFHFHIAKKFGVQINYLNSPQQLNNGTYGIIVDALLGTGTKGPARGIYSELIEWVNDQNSVVFSVDIPSGLSGNSSVVPGVAIRSDFTLAIHTQKIAHALYPARDYCGEISVMSIGISNRPFSDEAAKLFGAEDVTFDLPPKTAHKYSRGEILIIGGEEKMIGAVHWAAKGAMHSGVGYVTIAVPESSHSVIKQLCPSAVTLSMPELNSNIDIPASLDLIKGHLTKTRSILIGNGMGRSENRQNFLSALVEIIPTDIPVIIDADGLYLVKTLLDKLKNHQVIFTPHAGELRYLFSDMVDLDQHENIRWKALQDLLSEQWYLIAKGSPSVTIGKKGILVNSSGGPELAIAGSGDLLAGYLAGLCAYDHERILYNCGLANFIHGFAGEQAREKEGIFAVTMEKLSEYLPKAIHIISR